MVIEIYKTPDRSEAMIAGRMETSTFNGWSFDHSANPKDEVESLGIAADLLRQMFSGLLALARNNAALARALASRGPDALGRLSNLHKTVDLLMDLDDLSLALPLRCRATALISSLTGEIDELTLCAAGDECSPERSGMAATPARQTRQSREVPCSRVSPK
jgi:hypothetical protein